MPLKRVRALLLAGITGYILLMLLAVVFCCLGYGWSRWLCFASLVLLAVSIVFELFYWRCPCCGGRLGRRLFCAFCPRCGERLDLDL